MYFKGTIIITDPCYLINGDSEFTSDNMIKRDTIYGDWGCTTYKIYDTVEEWFKNIKAECEKIGEFCADSGQVCVCYLDEVLEFNPQLAKWILEHLWCVTVIPNYEGEVNFIIKDNKYLHVIGEGNTNFVTIQTSL